MFLDIIEDEEDDIVAIQRNARIGWTWPKKTLSYEIDKYYERGEKEIIRTAIDILQDILGHCINFEEKYRSDRVKVSKTDNYTCKSSVGYSGGKQVMKLHPKCFFKKSTKKVFYDTIHHEFLHFLGLYHEQRCK